MGVCDEPGSLLLKRATAIVQASSSVFILMQYLSHFNCTDNSLSIILTPCVDAMYVFTAIQDQKMLKSISDGFIPTQESQHLSFSWWSVKQNQLAPGATPGPCPAYSMLCLAPTCSLIIFFTLAFGSAPAPGEASQEMLCAPSLMQIWDASSLVQQQPLRSLPGLIALIWCCSLT